jgi:hypothetical protein
MIIICFLHVKHIVFCFAAAKTSGLALLLSPHGVDLILAWRTGHGAGKIVEGFKEHKMAGTVSQRRICWNIFKMIA